MLHQHWPFEDLRADARALNSALGLERSFELEVGVNPSFMVGRISPKSRFLGVSNARKWRRVVDSLNVGDFAEYRQGAETYFGDRDRFNAGHYLTSCKLLAHVARLPEPGDSRAAQQFADDYLVQVELVPFASSEASFSTAQVMSYQKGYASGRLATQVLDALLDTAPWDAVIVRGLGAPWAVMTERLRAGEGGRLPKVGRVASARISSRAVPVLGLANTRVGPDDVRRLAKMVTGD